MRDNTKKYASSAYGIDPFEALEILSTVMALAVWGGDNGKGTNSLIEELSKVYKGSQFAYASFIAGKLVAIHDERKVNPKAKKQGELGPLQEAFDLKSITMEKDFATFKTVVFNAIASRMEGYESLPDPNEN